MAAMHASVGCKRLCPCAHQQDRRRSARARGRAQSGNNIPEHGEDIVARELLAQVVDEYVLHTGRLSLLPRRLQLLALLVTQEKLSS